MGEYTKVSDEVGIDMENISDEEDGIHMHCLTCYKTTCVKFKNCPLTCCVHCGVKLHRCKLQEHSFVCRSLLRPCINQSNGCPFKFDSVSMMTHLEVCPASVIHCGMSWNRHPLYSRVRQQWLPFLHGNPIQVVGDLDTELAISDQLHLHKEMTARMRKGKYHIQDKRMKTRIDKGRLKKLDSLLTNTSPKNGNEKCIYKHTEVTNSSQSHNDDDDYDHGEEEEEEDEDEVEEDNTFVTYDEAMTSKSDLATFVTNSSMGNAYCDLPNNYVTTGNYICELITKVPPKKTNTKYESNLEITKEDFELRMKIYAELNVTYTPLGLNIIVEKLPKFQKQYPLYNFSCSKVYRRDQYTWHCLNIHSEIQDNLNSGTLFIRCPMAQYGCPYLQFVLKPKYGKVCFYKPFSSFTSTFDAFSLNCNIYKPGDLTLLDLHYDILLYILRFLDNMSLNCLAKTCHAMKNLCFEVLDKQGVVIPIWSKKTYANGRTSWQIEQMIKLFTTSCSPIRKWVHTDATPMGNHLAKCIFLKKPNISEPVKLPVSGPNINIPSILNMSERNSNYELV